MSSQQGVCSDRCDSFPPDLFQSSNPFFGYPDDDVPRPKPPQVERLVVQTISPHDSEFPDRCGFDLGLDLPSPTWLDDFLAEIDLTKDWEPPSFTQSLDTAFSQCSARRTGGSGSSTNYPSSIGDIYETRYPPSFLYPSMSNRLRGIGTWLVSSSDRYPDLGELSAELLTWLENPSLLNSRPQTSLNLQTRKDIQSVIASIDRHFECGNAIEAVSQTTTKCVHNSTSSELSDSIFTDDNADSLNMWLRKLPRLFGHLEESCAALHDPWLPQFLPAPLQMETLLPKAILETRSSGKDNKVPYKTAITKKHQLWPRRRLPKQQIRQKSYGSTSGNSDCSSTRDSAGTATSAGSSTGSHASWSGRKGRVTHEDIFSSFYPDRSNSNKSFQCTWCSKAFAKSGDWKRHEESLHAPQTEWICMPQGPETISHGRKICVFCRLVNPDDSHLYDHHRQATCLDGPFVRRRFDRKDHLIQHILLSHGITTTPNQPVDLLTWQRPMHDITRRPVWKCGFCDTSDMTWQQRYSHVAGHMKSGATVANWRHCVCTRKGIRPELLAAAEERGFEALYHSTCRKFWWCGTLEPFSGMPCHLYFDTQEARQSHWNTEHGGVSCLLNDDGNLCLTVGLPEEACVQFWCGFCVETIEMDDRTPYDCSRMNHFSSAHSGSTYDNRHWIAIEQKQWEDFTSNAVEILLNKGLMHNYPVNSRREVAWHFASRLLEHQRKLVPSKVPWAASSGTACATSFSDELDPATGT